VSVAELQIKQLDAITWTSWH